MSSLGDLKANRIKASNRLAAVRKNWGFNKSKYSNALEASVKAATQINIRLPQAPANVDVAPNPNFDEDLTQRNYRELFHFLENINRILTEDPDLEDEYGIDEFVSTLRLNVPKLEEYGEEIGKLNEEIESLMELIQMLTLKIDKKTRKFKKQDQKLSRKYEPNY